MSVVLGDVRTQKGPGSIYFQLAKAHQSFVIHYYVQQSIVIPVGATAEQVLSPRRGITQPAPADAPPNQGVQVGYPIEVSDEFNGAVVLDVTRRSETESRALLRQLHWGMAWLCDLFHRGTSASEEVKSERIVRITSISITPDG